MTLATLIVAIAALITSLTTAIFHHRVVRELKKIRDAL